MRKIIRTVIKYSVKRIKLNNYNCSPLDFYKPRKPNKLEYED